MRLSHLLPLFVLVACGSGADDGEGAPPTDTSADSFTEETEDSASTDTETSDLDCSEWTSGVIEVSPDELFVMMADKDFQLINVHVPYDGELPDTDVHIPYTDTDALEAYLNHDVAAKAVLYCKTGPMSRTATRNLADRGYCHIYDLPAGMNGWVEDGYSLKGSQ